MPAAGSKEMHSNLFAQKETSFPKQSENVLFLSAHKDEANMQVTGAFVRGIIGKMALLGFDYECESYPVMRKG